jgi:glycosyltransferase involved in cell wall biosynthesis
VQVLYSIGSRFAGPGIGTTALHAVRGLERHGLLRRVLCGSASPSDVPNGKVRRMGLVDQGMRWLASRTHSPRLWLWQAELFDAWAATQAQEGDLLHVWAGYGLRTLSRSRSLGCPGVVERASTHPRWQARVLREEYGRWGIRWAQPEAALARADAEIAAAGFVLIPSPHVRHTFLQAGVPESRLLEVPFGVDTQRFRPSPTSDHPFRALFVGSLGVRKGLPYLLEAWQSLGWRDAELEIVGRPDATWRAVLDRAGQVPGVRVTSFTPDLREVYGRADVFVFPSIEEGSALVTYEALASGLPVIATLEAGSVVRDGVEGRLVPARDSGALATAMDTLRAADRSPYRRAARARAEEFTWERYGDALASTYLALT